MAALENDPQTATRCLRDVVALATLPAIWAGAAPLRIAESLAASLFSMLDPEFVYVYFAGMDGKPPIAVAQTDRYQTSPALATEITNIIVDQARAGDPDEFLLLTPAEGKGVLHVAVRPLGADAELGVIAAAFLDRDDFRPSHGLVLNVGASQAVAAIQNARLLGSLQVSEERARAANEELSRHVVDLRESRRTALKSMEDAVQAQRTLSQRTAQYETLLNRAPIGVYLVDADFRIQEVNPTALPAFAPISGLIGRDFEEVMRLIWPSTVAEEVLRVFRHTLATGESHVTPELIEQRLDRGVKEYYEWRIDRIPLPDGRYGVVCYFRDISAQVLAREALRRANEDLSQFAFAASHDLQEPLRMITSYSQLLIKDSREGQLANDADLYTGYIVEGTRRIRELLADLLSYTAAGADGNLGQENVHLNDVFKVVVTQNLYAAIAESGAVVSRDDLPVLYGYTAHFVQLLQNLIGNALKYRAHQTPRIHVTAVRRHDEWRVAVSDNGIGIAPEYHEQIFGVFKRLHGRNIPGTGIGLAICQRVVGRYGGRIWVESEPDRGATFYFTLPVLEKASNYEQ